jgi:hypothetical protein
MRSSRASSFRSLIDRAQVKEMLSTPAVVPSNFRLRILFL